MAKTVFSQKKFFGFSDYIKDVVEPDHYYFAQSIDYRSDPQGITLLPDALLESGTVVMDLLKWADIVPYDLSVYSYGSTGGLYKRTSAGSWSLLRNIASSHGNGLSYFAGDDYLYYPTDSGIGRYGPISGTSQFSDNFLVSQGGQRLNTYSATFVAASSQYASATDSASLSLTGNLTLECYINPTSLPTTGNQMILMSKWRAGNNTRSYKFDIGAIAATFGDGTDGNLTISVDTTEAPIDSACTGTAASFTLSATNVSFAANQQILIHQTQGTNAGTWMRTSIVGYTAGTITTADALNITYGTGAQVRVLKKYGNVTINSGKTWTAKAWNGTVGGILAFLCNGTLTVTGNISADGCGFRGGSSAGGYQGEGTAGAGSGGNTTTANGNGGGGGNCTISNQSAGGGGGGNGTPGSVGTTKSQSIPGDGGGTSGNNSLTNITFGGAGGSGSSESGASAPGGGGNGGGIIFTYSNVISISGTITSKGIKGTDSGISNGGGGGAGSGGSVMLKAVTATLGSTLIVSTGGAAGSASTYAPGGAGGTGRIHIDYYTSYTGTTSPTLDSNQDNNLSSNTTYQLRLSVSNNGTANEIMARQCGLTTGAWKHVAVTWTAASHIAEFFLNGNTLGTSTGAITAISDNASSFLLASQDTDLGSYYDGKMDEVRVWNVIRSATDLYNNKDIQISASTTGLQAYYQLNNTWADQTANNNTLTAVNTPTFTTDTPFLSPTTRLDIDVSQAATGQTYTVPTTITETAANEVFFVPTVDPLKSISVLVASKGTGNWTLTLHDFANNVIATVTILNANLIAGVLNEFILPTPYRFQIGATLHFHLTSTVGDGTVTTNTTSNLSTVGYQTYFQILVTDTQFHPAVPFLNFIVIGNERYIATWDGVFYHPNLIAFPPQTHVRCFAFWRQYLAIGTWREATTGTPNVYDWPSGRIYFWDGISLTFNFFIDVPEGQINAMFGNNTMLYISAGYKGDLLVYQGGYSTGNGNSNSQKLKRIPLQAKSDYLEIYPGAMSMWRSLLHYGVAANSNSTTVTKGVYAWGTLNQVYPETLSLDYTISTGSVGNTVKIGLVYPVGQTLLVGWQDGQAFGCDQVNFTNPAASYGTLQTLLQDGGSIWHQEAVMKMRADYQPLKTGELVSLKYSLNRGSFVSMNTPDSTVGQTESYLQISNGRNQEYQLGIDLYSTNGTSPTILGLSAMIDELTEEEQF